MAATSPLQTGVAASSTVRPDDSPMRNISPVLAHLIEQQHGLITIRQLARAGFRGDCVTRRVIHGDRARMTSSIVRVSLLPMDRPTELWVASLHYEGAYLAGSSALEIEGLPQPKDGAIHLVGARSGRVSPLPQCVMHTQSHPTDVRLKPDRAAPLSAVVQVLRWARTDRQAAFQAVWALQRGLIDFDQLQEAVIRLPPGPGSAAVRRRMSLLIPGTHSVHELDFARGCRARGLPEPVRQRERLDSEGRRRYTDAEFNVAGRTLVVEIDGLQHLDRAVRMDDDWRGNELVIQGTPVLRVSTLALRVEPDRVYAQLQRALEQLRRAA